jgi:hypothetical protein
MSSLVEVLITSARLRYACLLRLWRFSVECLCLLMEREQSGLLYERPENGCFRAVHVIAKAEAGWSFSLYGAEASPTRPESSLFELSLMDSKETQMSGHCSILQCKCRISVTSAHCRQTLKLKAAYITALPCNSL